MKKKASEIKSRMSYEPEADVFSIEMSGKPIDHAKEVGNIVVHFTKQDVPVLIEILEASKFLGKIKNVIETKQLRKLAFASR